MEEILKKLSSYNIFNYLLPGVIFAFAVDAFTDIPVIQSDLLIGVFLYYFIGLVISRVGSLVVEAVLMRIGFVSKSDYESYVRAAEDDPLLPVLVEANNTYRTLSSLFIFIGGALLYDTFATSSAVFNQVAPYVALVLLFLLFVFAYRKQSRYITNRVNSHSGSDRENDS